MVHFLRFIVSKAFWINLLIALFLFSAGIYLTLLYIDDYTLHSDSVVVPDLVSTHISELDTLIASEGDFSVIVSDSIFQKDTKVGTVIEQNPLAGTTVKPGRKIYLTLSKSEPPMISMPNLVDMSLRQATSLLETYGLEVGELTYQPDLCKNCILKQRLIDKEVEPGSRIVRGLKIDLVVGAGLGNELTSVPYLIGTTASVAEIVLKSKSLNIGGTLFDENTVLSKEDSLNAKVYKQVPVHSEAPSLRMGDAVDIFLTLDTNRIIHTVNTTDSI